MTAKSVRRFGAGDVDIPELWRALSAADVIVLANTLAFAAVKRRNDAFDVIEAELARRANEVRAA